MPEAEKEQIAYYQQVAIDKPELGLKVEVLPKTFDARYVQSLNDKPGILALAMRKVTGSDGKPELRGKRFVVRR